jgi:hypothetical protein
MNLQTEYCQLVEQFSEFIASQNPYPENLIAPGNSASELAIVMRSTARRKGLTLPNIISTSHDESQKLYWCDESILPLVTPAINIAKQTLMFIEDYLSTGTKIQLIQTAMERCLGVNSEFIVMVGDGVHNPENTTIFAVNPEMVNWLNTKHNPTQS